jgi:uncharacterized protein YkwD
MADGVRVTNLFVAIVVALLIGVAGVALSFGNSAKAQTTGEGESTTGFWVPTNVDPTLYRPESCTGDTFTVTEREYETMRLINKERMDNGVRKLCAHIELSRATRSWAIEMHNGDFLSHGDLVARLSSFGYEANIVREVAMRGPATSEPLDAVNAWLASDNHRGKINNPDRRQMGAGVKRGTEKAYYVVDFGSGDTNP